MPLKPNQATCAVNYIDGNYNVLRYLEPCTEPVGPQEAAFVIVGLDCSSLRLQGVDMDEYLAEK